MNENTKPLKWHNFLIYFALWAKALSTLIDALNVFIGTHPHYGEMKSSIYQAAPSLRLLDIFAGMFMICLSVYAVYTRFQLAEFKKNAPDKLLYLYAAGTALSIIYLLIFAAVLGLPLKLLFSVKGILPKLIALVIILFINKKYYDNRKELFVN